MHEFSMTSQIVKEVLNQAEKHKAKKVKSVHLTIGELTFLGIEQVKFAYEILTKGTMMEGAKLLIKRTKGAVKCPDCGYEGHLKHRNDPLYHTSYPSFQCPKCNSRLEVIKGKECVIGTVKLEV